MSSFYENIHTAKSNRNKMITIFFVGYFVICLALSATLAVITYYLYDEQSTTNNSQEAFQETIAILPYFVATCFAIVSVIIAVSFLISVSKLKKGASFIVEETGAKSLNFVICCKNKTKKIDDLTDFEKENLKHITKNDLQRLCNVVQEMSIASCIPMPNIYIDLNNRSINAFAAGLSTKDAVICVTVGTLKKLNRSELQGVIAHEFSHICNGDMRNSMNAISLIFSMTAVYCIGIELLRFFSHSSTSSSSSNKKGKGILYIYLIAITLIVFGFLGKIFSELMQLAISRRAEYLADATSVKYTRNPFGLMNALNKIKVVNQQEINTNNSTLSHMYFANNSGSWLDTHPPLDNRIDAIAQIAHGMPETVGKLYTFNSDEIADVQEKENSKGSSLFNLSSLNDNQAEILTTVLTAAEALDKNKPQIKQTEKAVAKTKNLVLAKYDTVIANAIMSCCENSTNYTNAITKLQLLTSPNFVNNSFDDKAKSIFTLIQIYKDGDDAERKYINKSIEKALTNTLAKIVLEVSLYLSIPPQNYHVPLGLYSDALTTIYSYIISINKLSNQKDKEKALAKALTSANISANTLITNITLTKLKEHLKLIRYVPIDYKERFYKGLDIAIKSDGNLSYEETLFLLFSKVIEPSMKINGNKFETATTYADEQINFNNITGDFLGSCININTIHTLNINNACTLNQTLKPATSALTLEELSTKLNAFGYVLKSATKEQRGELRILLNELINLESTNILPYLTYILLNSKYNGLLKTVPLPKFTENAHVIYCYIAQNSVLNPNINPQFILDTAMEAADLPHLPFEIQQLERLQQAFSFMQGIKIELKNRVMLGIEAAIKADGNISTEENFILVFSRYLLNN